MTEHKIEIPISSTSDQGTLVGILRRQDSSPLPSKSLPPPKPITLILHGVLAHKDQLYHRKLAQTLPCDSFRFDFRHADQGGESRHAPGEGWHMSNFDQDILDIHTTILFLRKTFNYHVESVIAHSRGVLNMWLYFWDVEMRRLNLISNVNQNFILDRIPFYVALAGRWDMQRMRKRFPDNSQELQQKGYFEWKVRVAGKTFSVNVTKPMVDGFCNFPIADLVNKFPTEVDTLLVHGTKDVTVPFQDAFAYMEKLKDHMQPPRRNASTDLELIEGADHTFKGHFDTLIKISCDYLNRRRKAVLDNDEDASPAAIEFQRHCRLSPLSPQSPASKL
jgi:uncharacterized protein